MKQVRQAARRREDKEESRLLIFCSIEQLIGFLFFILIISVSVWVVTSFKNWIDNPEQMVLSQLVLNGDHAFTDEDDIRQAILGLGLPNTYIGQNVDDIQQEIMQFPWIKQASVRKQWPDRLIVSIEEYKPAFYWNDLFLLDNNGNIFNVPSDHFVERKLPKLYGPEGKEKTIVKIYYKFDDLSKKLASSRLTLQIKSAVSNERNAWQLMIKQCIAGICHENQEIKLILGSENIEQRYLQFIKLLPEIQARIPKDEKIMVADLRYESGISVIKEKTVQ